ncbi:DUF732 domain-containing protein [Rhodococcus sp. (in: high G+C Gram-positive bacteria)]|uniref:DUF732 domain-containing protein n=1 Tax=Rhodococcus sp. TaxID=1831 RepID=UPI003B8A6842
MIRSARLGLFSALSTSVLFLAGCSSTPTDGEPVVISRAAPQPAAATTPVSAPPRVLPTSSETSSAPGTTSWAPVPGADSAPPHTLEPATELSAEDLLFLSYITEFTLMEKSESDQIRLGLSMCNALYRGQSKPDVTADYQGDGRYTAAEVTNVLGAATVSYCPEFA